jgi:hypothetical protein
MNMRRKFLGPVLTLVSLAIAGSSSIARAEVDKETAVKAALAGLLTDAGVAVDKSVPLSDASAHKQARLSWQSSLALKSTGANQMEQRPSPGTLALMMSARRDGAAPSDRTLELSTEQMLVVALDERGGLRWWKLMLDPRLVRSETVTATGEVHGETFYRPKVDFAIEYPDDARITQLRFYHPVWDGKEFHLESVAALTVR